MIETKIQELTEAIRQLTVSLNAMRPMAAAPTPVAAPAPVKVAPAPAPAPTPEPSAEEVEDEETPVVPAPGKVTQADLRDAASKLLEQKKLPEILRINREHGIRRITDCPEEKYESVYAALTAAIADGQKS
jgi:hypothetical protein